MNYGMDRRLARQYAAGGGLPTSANGSGNMFVVGA